MNEQERKEIIEIVGTIVSAAIETSYEKHMAITLEHHTRHHDFIETLIRKEKRRVELTEKVKQTVIGWFFIVCISGIGISVYQYAKRLIGDK